MVEQLTPKRSVGKHIERVLNEKKEQHKEDVARWSKDNPLREPGTSLKTWKSYTRVRQTSQEFRNGYDQIRWNSA